MKREFNEIISTLKESISTYEYFVDFNKVFKNVNDIEYHLNTLNYLLGKEDFDNEFKKVLSNNRESIEALPILLAIREKNITIYDEILIKYDFNKFKDEEYYLNFIKKTGLINLFFDRRIRNLIDYVTGVEVGLDSNSRKNRSGTMMEGIVLKHLEKVNNIEINKEMNIKEVRKKYNIDIPIDNDNKRFDFVVRNKDNKIFLIEVNYYKASGSKLNETSRSFAKLANDLKNITNVSFIWITDGLGWLSTKNNFKEAYDNIEYLFNLYDLENNVLNILFNE